MGGEGAGDGASWWEGGEGGMGTGEESVEGG